MLNIPSSIDDPNYRYKMPKLLAKIEGRGNGIKTNIVNMSDVAKALKRPPGYPTKFFGCELGALSSYGEKEDKAIVNGAHDGEKLQELLDKFIALYVLCPNCSLPEIDLSIKKGSIVYKCNACGARGTGDNAHKLATYILKNPPTGVDSTTGKKSKTTKEERQAAKAAKQRGDTASGAEDDKEEGSEKPEKKKKKKKDKEKDKDDATRKEKRERRKKEKSLIDGGSPADSSREDGAESDESSSPKALKGNKSKTISTSDNDVFDFDNPDVLEVVGRVRSFYRDNSSVPVKDFYGEVRNYQVAEDFDARVRLFVVLAALFGTDDSQQSLTPSALKKAMPYIISVLDATISPEEILGVLETFVARYHSKLLEGEQPTPFSLVLKVLYDEEAIDEAAFTAHYNQEKEDGEYIKCRNAAQFFLDWLGDADSESGDENSSGRSDDGIAS